MGVISNVNLEYEARAMLTEQEYLTIEDKYLSEYKNAVFSVNENAYFDTPDFSITDHHMVLRVRTINGGTKELTLKIQTSDVCIEINHILTPEQEKILYETGRIPNQPIRGMLLDNGVRLREIRYITTLKTERIEIKFDNYLFVLDKNYYRNKVDYNIEVESTSENEAQRILKEILDSFRIEYRSNYINKAKRAIKDL